MDSKLIRSKDSKNLLESVILLEKSLADLINIKTENLQKTQCTYYPDSKDLVKYHLNLLSLIRTTNKMNELSQTKLKKFIKLSWEDPILIKKCLIFLKVMNLK